MRHFVAKSLLKLPNLVTLSTRFFVQGAQQLMLDEGLYCQTNLGIALHALHVAIVLAFQITIWADSYTSAKELLT